jgi:hypothetical protein
LILVTVRYDGTFTLGKAPHFCNPRQPVEEVPDEQGFPVIVTQAAGIENTFAGGKGKHVLPPCRSLYRTVFARCAICGYFF